MPIEIQELVIRINVTETAAPALDWQALQQRLQAELLEQCRVEIQAQLQRVAER